MANIKKLKANGQDIVPITHEQAVLDSNGVTLDSKLNAINNAISRLENNSTSGTPSNPSLGGNTTIITMGNYTIKYNETDDTLDFIYNGGTGGGTPEEPTTEEVVPLSWVVGNLNSSGAETVQDNTLRTGFVAIEDNYDYSFYLDTSMEDPRGIRVYFYDTNKTFISRTDGYALGYTTGVDIPIDIPSNTAYLRFKSNKNTSTTLNNINTLFTLRKTKTAIVNSYVREGLSMYIDATHGSISDITGNHTITNHGVTHTSDNNYLNFVASESDYIDTDFVPNLTQWSAEIYFNFTAIPTSSENVFVWGEGSNQIRVAYSGGSKIFAIQCNSGTNYKITDTSNILTPHHLIFTMNNGTITLYFDGVKSIITSGAGVQTSPQTLTLKIGGNYSGTSAFANMNLKIFRFYDGKVLSDEEALQNYNYETNRNSEPGTGGTTQEEVVPLTWAVGNLSSTGAEKPQENSLRSSFAAIEDNYDYTFYMDNSMYDPSGVRVYFYDTNKTYISRTDGNTLGYTSGTNISIDIPTNAAYMRFKANASGTTSVDTIGSLFTLRKTLK